MLRGSARSVIVAVAYLNALAIAGAQPVPLGTELQVNTFFTSLQLTSFGSVDLEANGDFVGELQVNIYTP